MDNETKRPLLCVVPRYIAPLKYFEKLVPALSEHFDVCFAPLEDRGMVAYCHKRGLAVTTDLIARRESSRIPFIAHVLDEERFLGLAEGFIRSRKPAVLLTETTIPQRTRFLFECARRHGVRTLALQWCQASKATAGVRLSLRNQFRRLAARHGGVGRALIRESYFMLLRWFFKLLNLLTDDHYRRTDLHVGSLGVIEERAKDVFAERGFPRDCMQVVGFADATLLNELKRKLQRNAAFRSELLRRYGMTAGRTAILIIPTMFHAGFATVSMSPAGQVAYFGAIIEDIRRVYQKEEADILFKVHPRDGRAFYEPLEPFGVRLIGNEGDIEELVALSDLVISHPMTTANFTVTISNTPALFINFSSVSYLNEGETLYRLREIIASHESFIERLRAFRAGRLPLQYMQSDIPADSLQRIVAFVRGDHSRRNTAYDHANITA